MNLRPPAQALILFTGGHPQTPTSLVKRCHELDIQMVGMDNGITGHASAGRNLLRKRTYEGKSKSILKCTPDFREGQSYCDSSVQFVLITLNSAA